MIRGAQEALWARGKVMLVVNAGYDADLTEASLEALLERRVEGIIYAAMYHRPVDVLPQAASVPIVLTNCFAADRSLPSVVPDEVSGGYAATKHLLEKGHRRIGFINLGDTGRGVPPPLPAGVPPPLPASNGRLEGYQKALREYGVAFEPALLHYTNQTPECNYRLSCDLMRMSDPPTAIFCGNDRTALGCYGALSDLGLRVPEQVAVVGFDNFKDIADGPLRILRMVCGRH